MNGVAPQSNIEPDFRLWLQRQLTVRCQRNPRYSLRAFSSLLDMDASSVSQILSGKRSASTKVIQKVCQKLDADPRQRDHFLRSAKAKRVSLPSVTPPPEYDVFAEDSMAFISDWCHYAILELVNVEGFRNKPAWIARALGISALEARIAIERMIRLGLLRIEAGRLVRTNKFLTNFTPGMTSAAHKKLQRQILEKALDAIDNATQEEKDITSMTMAIDRSKLPEARKMIARFRRDLCAFLEDGEQTQVYNLGVQLYPISKIKNEKGAKK